jgi:hypothetical protein
MRLTSILLRICELQPKWTSKNTPEMEERGVLVRKSLVHALGEYEERFKNALGKYASEWHLYGRDGSGPKTEAPWIRACSRLMSPSATQGFYMVVHFAADGSAVFVTIGHGSNNWHANGSLTPYKPAKLAEITERGRRILTEACGSLEPFIDRISLGAKNSGPENFERATVCAKRIPVEQLTDDLFIGYIVRALEMLAVIYDGVTLGACQDAAMLDQRDVDNFSNPLKKSKSGQGFGASAADRKAIEICAMKQAELWLKSNKFSHIKDCSGEESYDFAAKRDNKTWIIEVKGTTADSADAILMTANEVELHKSKKGMSVLIIVSGIRLDRSITPCLASGGNVWADVGWDINKWGLVPTAYRVSKMVR